MAVLVKFDALNMKYISSELSHFMLIISLVKQRSALACLISNNAHLLFQTAPEDYSNNVKVMNPKKAKDFKLFAWINVHQKFEREATGEFR